ncbi:MULTISPECIES: SDR family NAD(P)-dependent oxidoreductase [Trichocoleus]|uniref:SDR family NAD(P)-dependent oxidoreductase n=1 Tax=Trichocoleus desertorum GB2-A4 TaxID=2933944 RepID=A0ABV0JH84_9CYAN|nr:SDR family NAD(P)-dependent oxidoreductase [Trichocoleus sp. FACHB-46]MBD1865575.1 SDR family NAD(P)-dependent oxidoreductase [Trichocoleus sp. FACHB-46]
MTGKLDGKVAIITGASAGIGEATAIALAAEGAKVAIVARRGDRLDALAQRITAKDGEALAIVADITDDAQIQTLVDKTKTTWGQIDILINNAGIALTGEIATANPDDWRRMIDLNLVALMNVTHAVLPILQAQGTGHIVNISSVAGRTIRVGIGGYNVTKWGVNAFSEALRQEISQQNIRVTVIEPGMVNTEINQHTTDSIARQRSEERRKSITPLESEDIAAAIVYAVTQPARVNVNEILIRPTLQTW